MRARDRVGHSAAIVLVCGCLSGTTWALGTYSMNPTDIDGRALPGFYPNVELDVAYDDNARRTETNTQGSLLAILKPELQWVGVVRKHLIRVGYQGEYARFDSTPSEDYSDHFLGGDVTLDLTRKLNVNLAANYRREHEQRGNAGSINTGLEPNRWKQWAVAAEAVYGRRIAKAQVAAKLEHRSRDYINNDQYLRDYNADLLVLTLFYNLGPKTQLLVEPRYTILDYPNSNLDNDVRELLAGVTWKATAKTTGEFKIGYFSKDFDDPALADATGLAVDAKVVWKPKTYSTVSGLLRRDVGDSTIMGGSSSFKSLIARVDWEHELSRLTTLEAGARYQNDNYDVGREDNTYDLYVGVNYELKRWLTVGARLDHSTRDSNVAGNDYDDNRVTVGVKSTLQ